MKKEQCLLSSVYCSLLHRCREFFVSNLRSPCTHCLIFGRWMYFKSSVSRFVQTAQCTGDEVRSFKMANFSKEWLLLFSLRRQPWKLYLNETLNCPSRSSKHLLPLQRFSFLSKCFLQSASLSLFLSMCTFPLLLLLLWSQVKTLCPVFHLHWLTVNCVGRNLSCL